MTRDAGVYDARPLAARGMQVRMADAAIENVDSDVLWSHVSAIDCDRRERGFAVCVHKLGRMLFLLIVGVGRRAVRTAVKVRAQRHVFTSPIRRRSELLFERSLSASDPARGARAVQARDGLDDGVAACLGSPICLPAMSSRAFIVAPAVFCNRLLRSARADGEVRRKSVRKAPGSTSVTLIRAAQLLARGFREPFDANFEAV